MRMSDTPISTDDRDKDRNIIRNNLMDELCKRQRNFEANGGDQRWSFREVWQSGFLHLTNSFLIVAFLGINLDLD